MKKIWVWLFVGAYSVGVILMHRTCNELAGKLIGIMGMSPYLFTNRLVAVLGVLAVMVFLGREWLKTPARLKGLAVFLPIALVLDLSLISVPIERIHYLQYAILTWIAYLAIGSPMPAAMLAFAISVFDEGYQYWILYANDPIVYFDWNDLALNLIGVLFVLYFVLPMRPPGRMTKTPVLGTLALWILMSYLIVSTLHPEHVLVRRDPYNGVDSFWITSNIKTTYHVMDTLQGLIFLGIVIIPTIGYYLPQEERT